MEGAEFEGIVVAAWKGERAKTGERTEQVGLIYDLLGSGKGQPPTVAAPVTIYE